MSPADPARRAMVERLSRGPAAVSELARPLPMSLPSVMQHLGLLEGAGLVHSAKIGRVRTFSIQTATLSLADQWIKARRHEWEQRLDRLGNLLVTEQGAFRNGYEDAGSREHGTAYLLDGLGASLEARTI